MINKTEIPEHFDIKISFGQLANPQGALPGSLAYAFRQALEKIGVSEQNFDERVAGYI